MAEPQMEYKAVAEELKASGDKGQYDGHFSIFNNIDDGQDIIHDGAFKKTIQERRSRVKVFYAHDWMKLIGPPPDTLEEDSIGLHAAGHLTLDSFWGRETWALMKDNALKEGSIGFMPVRDRVEWDDAGIRHLREVKLYEISPVPLGMNPLTNVDAIKALQRARSPQDTLEVFSVLVKSLTETDFTAENAEAWQGAVAEVSGQLEAFSKKQAAAAPRKHSALLERRMRAAQLALSLNNS